MFEKTNKQNDQIGQTWEKKDMIKNPPEYTNLPDAVLADISGGADAKAIFKTNPSSDTYSSNNYFYVSYTIIDGC
ncbi:MAG: hypothetical protein AAFY20_25770 [Cyanobacteria bacterium J06639_14]